VWGCGTTAKKRGLLPFLFHGIYQDFTADPDPDPAFHFIADPDPPFFTSMRIRNRILVFIKIRGFCDYWSIDPPGFRIPPWLCFWAFNADAKQFGNKIAT
jgi:hypothetical protein